MASPAPRPCARASAAPCCAESMRRWAAQRLHPLLSHPVMAYPNPYTCHGASPQPRPRSAPPQSSGKLPAPGARPQPLSLLVLILLIFLLLVVLLHVALPLLAGWACRTAGSPFIDVLRCLSIR